MASLRTSRRGAWGSQALGRRGCAGQHVGSSGAGATVSERVSAQASSTRSADQTHLVPLNEASSLVETAAVRYRLGQVGVEKLLASSRREKRGS